MDPAAGTPTLGTRRVAALFALQGIGTGLILPFLVPILSGRGLGPAEIGLVLGASALAGAAAFPISGYLADGRVGRLAVLRWSSFGAAVAGLGLAWIGVGGLGRELALAAIAVAAVSATIAPWGPVSDAIALEARGAGPADYGMIRRWTSLGWVVAALAGGAAYSLIGPEVPLVGFAAVAIAIGTVASAEPPATARPVDTGPGAPAGPAVRAAAPDGDRAGLLEFLRLVRSSPVALPFFLALIVLTAGGAAANSFVPLRILDTGGGPFLVGLASALPALAEIPLFSRSGAIAARIGLPGLLAVGTSIAALQLLVFAVVADPWIVAAVRMVDGAAFALRYSAIVLVVAAVLPERVRAMGQATTWFVIGGLAPIVAGPIGGIVYERFGGPALFVGSAAAVVVGIVVALAALGRDPSRLGAGAGADTDR